ncbi:MAG: hypothetical protein WCB46_09980 [Methanoregula sp.]
MRQGSVDTGIRVATEQSSRRIPADPPAYFLLERGIGIITFTIAPVLAEYKGQKPKK